MKLVKKLSYCSCDKLTKPPKCGWLEKILLKLIPHFDIVKNIKVKEKIKFGKKKETIVEYGQTVLYLRRFYIFRSRWIGLNFGDIYLHHIYRSDDDKYPHTHPWNFLTFVLSGGYREEIYKWRTFKTKKGKLTGPSLKRLKAGDIVLRQAEHIHKVVITDNKPAWTLVFTGKYKREWTFVTDNGPVYWRKYLNYWGEYGD